MIRTIVCFAPYEQHEHVIAQIQACLNEGKGPTREATGLPICQFDIDRRFQVRVRAKVPLEMGPHDHDRLQVTAMFSSESKDIAQALAFVQLMQSIPGAAEFAHLSLIGEYQGLAYYLQTSKMELVPLKNLTDMLKKLNDAIVRFLAFADEALPALASDLEEALASGETSVNSPLKQDLFRFCLERLGDRLFASYFEVSEELAESTPTPAPKGASFIPYY